MMFNVCEDGDIILINNLILFQNIKCILYTINKKNLFYSGFHIIIFIIFLE